MARGWHGSNRKSRLPKDWQSRRKQVIHRDGGVCQWPVEQGGICGATGTDVDHIVPGDVDDLSNLWLLCRWHHNRKTGIDSARTQAEAKRAHRGVIPPHPGMMW